MWSYLGTRRCYNIRKERRDIHKISFLHRLAGIRQCRHPKTFQVGDNTLHCGTLSRVFRPTIHHHKPNSVVHMLRTGWRLQEHGNGNDHLAFAHIVVWDFLSKHLDRKDGISLLCMVFLGRLLVLPPDIRGRMRKHHFQPSLLSVRAYIDSLL